MGEEFKPELYVNYVIDDNTIKINTKNTAEYIVFFLRALPARYSFMEILAKSKFPKNRYLSLNNNDYYKLIKYIVSKLFAARGKYIISDPARGIDPRKFIKYEVESHGILSIHIDDHKQTIDINEMINRSDSLHNEAVKLYLVVYEDYGYITIKEQHCIIHYIEMILKRTIEKETKEANSNKNSSVDKKDQPSEGIEPVQVGSGDPSPSDIRHINDPSDPWYGWDIYYPPQSDINCIKNEEKIVIPSSKNLCNIPFKYDEILDIVNLTSVHLEYKDNGHLHYVDTEHNIDYDLGIITEDNEFKSIFNQELSIKNKGDITNMGYYTRTVKTVKDGTGFSIKNTITIDPSTSAIAKLILLNIFTVKDMKVNNKALIVFWSDGSKTVVRQQEDESKFDIEKAIFAAYTKKIMSYFTLSKDRSMDKMLNKWIKKVGDEEAERKAKLKEKANKKAKNKINSIAKKANEVDKKYSASEDNKVDNTIEAKKSSHKKKK